MLRSSGGQLVLSATDLTNHLGCLHLTHERRRIALGLRTKPAPVDDAHADLVRERGEATRPSGSLISCEAGEGCTPT